MTILRACLKERKETRERERVKERERKSAIRNKDKIPKCNRICRIYTQFTIPRGSLLFFEPLYNYITLSCIVTRSHTCINIGFYMWFLYIHLSNAFETLDTRANDAELRAEKYTEAEGRA